MAAAVCLTAFVLIDILERSFVRVTHAWDAQTGWLSCILSHFADVLVLGGIFLSEHRFGGVQSGELILAATTVSLFGSLVRVSALQAGFRFWRSPLERLFRFSAFFAYTGAALINRHALGAAIAAILVTLFGAGEAVRVMYKVSKLRKGSGLILVTPGDTDSIGYEEDDDALSRWPTPTPKGNRWDEELNSIVNQGGRGSVPGSSGGRKP
jgi:hypothetical protein